MMKEEALKLADYVDAREINNPHLKEASAMLRRLVERMVELESCLDFAVQDTMDYITLNNLGGENNHWLVWARKLLINKTLQTKPLSDEEIIDIWFAIPNGTLKARTIDFARLVEERHGIK